MPTLATPVVQARRSITQQPDLAPAACLTDQAREALCRLYVAHRDAQFGFALCGLFVSDHTLRIALRSGALEARASTEVLAQALGEAVAGVARPQGWALTVGKSDNDQCLVDKYRADTDRVLTACRDALDARLPAGWVAWVKRQFKNALLQYQEVTRAAHAVYGTQVDQRCRTGAVSKANVYSADACHSSAGVARTSLC